MVLDLVATVAVFCDLRLGWSKHGCGNSENVAPNEIRSGMINVSVQHIVLLYDQDTTLLLVLTITTLGFDRSCFIGANSSKSK